MRLRRSEVELVGHVRQALGDDQPRLKEIATIPPHRGCLAEPEFLPALMADIAPSDVLS